MNAMLSPLFSWRAAICDSTLAPTTRLVALTLSLHMNERGGSAFPKQATLARESGLSVDTVRDHLQKLRETGWLVALTYATPGRPVEYAAAIPQGGVQTPTLGGVENPTQDVITGRREEPNGSSLARPRNELWDALTEIFGEPATKSAQTLRGKVYNSLAAAGAKPDEVLARARSWPKHFDNATLTEAALEKHWHTLARPPMRLEERRGRSLRRAG